jgi:hypothetical protein
MRPLDCALKVRSLTIPLASRRLSMFANKWSMGAGADPPTGLGYWEATEQKSSIRKMSSNFLDGVELRKVASPDETKKTVR